MSGLRYRCFTKATDRAAAPPRPSRHWATSRRAWLKVFDDRLECGDWVVPVEAVTSATLYLSSVPLNPLKVLRLDTADRTFQFGLNPWCRIARHLPFEPRVETIRPAWALVSLLVRLALVAYLVYFVWRIVV